MGPTAKRQTPATTQVQTNGAPTLVKLVRSPAVVGAVQHADPHGSCSLATTDRNEFVREVLTLLHVRFIFLVSPVAFDSFLMVRFETSMLILDRLWTEYRART
jgi:hypothetical protein